jgi:hypothetical protein
MTHDITPFDLSAVEQALLTFLTARQQLLRRSVGRLEPQLAVSTPVPVPYLSRVPSDSQEARFTCDRRYGADERYVRGRR